MELNQPNNIEEMQAYSRKEVDMLISQYKRYKELGEEITLLEQKLEGRAKATPKTGWLSKGVFSSHDPQAEEKGNMHILKQQQEDIGLAMKFQNPIIWAMYKFQAYASESNPIRTVEDLVKHSLADGICGKRILYINRHLESKFGKNLATGLFSPSLSIPLLVEDEKYTSLPLDQEFMKEWFSFENHEGGKWHGYK